jgi:hypothetical protein
MNSTEHYAEHWHEVPRSEYVVVIGDQGATLLCEAHMNAMKFTCESAGISCDVYQVPPDEEPVACQACHLAETNRPKIILH